MNTSCNSPEPPTLMPAWQLLGVLVLCISRDLERSRAVHSACAPSRALHPQGRRRSLETAGDRLRSSEIAEAARDRSRCRTPTRLTNNCSAGIRMGGSRLLHSVCNWRMELIYCINIIVTDFGLAQNRYLRKGESDFMSKGSGLYRA